jgi:transcriptional regulator with XRE-family HTH domain
MKAQGLQENLRRILWQRIDSGQLTGLKLAEQTGFQQAHVSNFLNRKRSLSIEGLDRFLSAQHLSVLDLVDQAEINKRASIEAPSEDEFENVCAGGGASRGHAGDDRE